MSDGIQTFMDCPDLKPNIKIWGSNEIEDMCFNMSVDGKNAHNCLELCTTGYDGHVCPRGFQR